MDHNINGEIKSCKNEPSCLFVKDISDLAIACETLAKEKVIGVDLESDSMFHYKEKVCLIQISVPDLNILIDTLSIRDLEPLSPILSNPDIRKVFHGADYDIRSLSRDFSVEVNSLFDTQIAAKFLGMTQTGLSSILENRFGIRLEKKFQKSDWSRRPLSRDMLRYAVQDTCYLIPLSMMLESELIEKGRLAWFEEECKLQSMVRFSPPRQDPLYTRFKGASKLAPRDLAIIDEILKWREDLSRKRDIPPFKIISNQQVLDLAGRKPTELDDLDILSKKQIVSIGKSILNCVQSAMAIPEDRLPIFPREKRQKHGSATLKKINALKEWRDRFGKESGLDPSIICPNALIEAVAVMHPCSPDGLKELGEMRRWQIKLFGNEICDLLASISITEK
jgi:ribonuclease D